MTYSWKKGMSIDQQWESWQEHNPLDKIEAPDTATLKEAVDRTPSERFAEFIQGIIGTVTSGGNLKLYFLNRSEYYAQQNRVHVKDVLQQMALFSEAYVVVAVALPIFAMIIAVITLYVL